MPGGEVDALAHVVEQHRSRVPGSEAWDRAAVAAQLRKLDLEPGDALTVALRAASDAGARTPATIGWDCYAYGIAGPSRTVHRPLCVTCGRPQLACLRAQRNTGTDQHSFCSREGDDRDFEAM